MVAVGFASIPVIPSLDGITKELEKSLAGPIEQASKRAGQAIEKNIGSSAEAAAKNVERANFRVLKSTQELEVAESKLTEQKLKTEAANKAVETAMRRRAEAESKGIDAIEKAEQDLLKKRATAEREVRNLAKAEAGVEKALTESSTATKKLADRQDELNKANQGAEGSAKSLRDRLREMGNEAADAGEKSGGLGDKLMSGLGKIGTGALLGVGAKIGTSVMSGVGTAFDKGFSRLASIEQAETMLSGLGNSAAEVDSIMDSAMESVSGTAFGFGEAASMAATFSGAGIKDATELTRILSLVGDTASITGADFNEMGAIWTKVATGQKLQTAEMNQLMDRGLGVLPELQKHYGVTADEARKMVTEGKVDFEDFSEIMESMVGGSAQLMGDTFSGSAANMQAALGRLGAKFMDPVYAVAPAIFQAIGGSVDKLGEYLTPLIEDFSERFAPVMEDFAERLGPWLEQAIDKAAESIKNMVEWGRAAIEWMKDNQTWLEPLAVGVAAMAGSWWAWTTAIKAYTAATKAYTAATKIASTVTAIFDKITKKTIFGAIAMAVIGLVAALTYFFTKTETGQKIWAKFTDFIKKSWDSVSEKFGSVIDWITEKWESLTTGIGDGWDWVTEKIGAGVDWITEKWDSFTGWISDAWNGITSLFQGDYTSAFRDAFGIEEDSPIILGFFFLRDTVVKVGEILKAVWDGIVTAGKIAFAIIGTVVLTPLILLWNYMSSQIKYAWEKIIKPTWDALSSAASWMWENVLQPTFQWIQDAWTAVGDKFAEIWALIRETVIDPLVEKFNEVSAWWSDVMTVMGEAWSVLRDRLVEVFENIKTAVFDAFTWYIDRVRANWDIVTGALATAWGWIRDIFVAVFEEIRDRVFNVFNFYVDLIKSGFEIAVGAMSAAWGVLRDALGAAWGWMRDNVFSKFEGTINTVKSSFETAVDAIGRAWSSLKALLAEPVNFIIREIYMGGIREAWGKVADLVDLPPLPEVKEIGGFARGGILPGYSRMVDGDDQLVPMRRGEGVLVSEGLQDKPSRQLFLAANEEAKRGKSFAAFMSDYVAGYAGGGIVGSLNSIMRKFYPELQMTSHFRPGDSGYHGKNMAADFSNTGSGMPSTPAMQAAAAFMYGNYGDQLEQLIHHPARNIGSGMDVGDGFGYYGAGTMYGHTDHIHLAALKALVDPSGVVQMIPYDGESGGGFSLSSMVKSLWDSVIGKIAKFTDGAGLVAELPGAFLKKTAGAAWDFISGRIGNFFGSAGSVGDAESWRDMAVSAMRRNGFNADDPAQVNAMLAQIMSESGGNPNIAQQIVDMNGTGESAGVGLLQIIPGTFAANRDPSLPDDRRDPWANMNAALRYYKGRYGTDLTTMWGHGHGYAEGGIIDAPHIGIYDTGGVLPKGGVAVNTSAFDEVIVNGPNLQAINNLANNVGALVRKLAQDRDVDAFAAALAKEMEPVVTELRKMADPSTVEGMTLRSVADRVLGMDLLPYGNVVETVMKAETDLLNARSGHAERLQGIVDKEKALAEAQDALEKLMSDDSGMSVQSARKLEDAQKALSKAQEDAAKSANAEYKDAGKRADAQAKAADKVTDAEEKLERVREDIAASADSDAEKRAEDIVKATEAVSKAENDLVSARQESVKALDHIILPDTLGGLIPQIGQAAGMLGGVLPEVAAGLTGLAATALPAGISLGVALAAVQVALDVAREIWGAIDELVERINAARVFEAEGWAQTFASIAEWTRLVEGQRQSVSALQQQMISDQIALTAATWDVRVAQFDQMRAQLEGVKNVATAQAALDAERERAARQALWETDSLTGAFDRYRWAQKVGWDDLLRDAVIITPEILALQHELNATKLLAEASELEAAKNTLTAIHQMNLASINLGRTQSKLLDQMELLAKMEGTNFGMTGEESRVISELSEIMADNARLNADRNSLGNRAKDALGQTAQFLTFGMFGNTWGNTQDAFDEAIRMNNTRMDRIMDQYSDLVSPEVFAEMQAAMRRATDQYAAGNAAGAEAILRGEVFGRAEAAIKDAQLDRDIYDWRQEQEDLRNSIEDSKLDLDYQTKLQEYIEKIFALESGASSEQYSADAIREQNPVVRAALEELASRDADIARSVVEKQPVNITLTGDAVSTDKVRELLEELNGRSEDLDIRVTQLEEPEDDDLLDAVNSRRRYR